MARTNGKSDIKSPDIDAEHELPAGEGEDEARGSIPNTPVAPASDLQKLIAERDALVDRMARMQADFENARKRAAKEQQEFREYASTNTIKELLPVLDSFERALHASSRERSELRNGVELIYKQLQDALAKLGLRPISAKGEPFDPHLHEAVEMVETTDVPDHQIVEELQQGYKLKDRLLRPAMVKVARNSKH
jgi:molecular chaperone GrpE